MTTSSFPVSPIQNHFCKRFSDGEHLQTPASIVVTTQQALVFDEVVIRARTLTQTMDIFRTSFSRDDMGLLWQHPVSNIQILAEEADWRHLDEEQRGQQYQALIQQASPMPHQPWLKIVVAKLSDNQSALAICLPGIHCDGVTLGLVARALADGKALAPENVQYTDVAPWLNDFLLDDELAGARKYWMSKDLAPFYATQFGLANYLQSDTQNQGRSMVGVSLNDLFPALEQYCQTSGASACDLVAASLRLYINQFADNTSMARVIDSRNDPALASASGPLSRALPVSPETATSLTEAVKHEQQALSEVAAYVECYQSQPAWEGHSFSFVYDHVEAHSNSTTVEHLDWQCEDALCQFTLIEQGPQSRLLFSAREEFMSSSVLNEFANNWLEYLAGAINEQVTSQGPALQLNGGQSPKASEFENVLDWFVDQLDRTGSQPVINADDSLVTYQHIHDASNRLANVLIQQGVKPADTVAICLDRSSDFLIAMLATLKTGAAYLPIDQDLPRGRISFMLEDAKAQVLIGESIDPQVNLTTVNMSELNLESVASQLPKVTIQAQDQAYLLYTSGSTGTPKGIRMSHGALLNHMLWMVKEFDFTPQDTLAQRTSVSFDASIWEYWVPLLTGTRLLMVANEANYDPDQLLKRLTQHNATILQMVPTHLSTLLDSAKALNDVSLRVLFCGGEALDRGTAQRATDRFNCELVNLYGPSECCIQTVFWRYQTSLTLPHVPIGHAIDEVKLKVVDAHGKSVGPGEQGELWIGGPCLFSGYQSQTAPPWGKIKGDATRYYRSGDVVRILHDGALLYLERLDDQVKINGFRIELGEIASLIEAEFHNVTALCLQDPESQALILFYSGDADKQQIDTLLNGRLPAYMIPSQYLGLDNFPVLSSGKTDRQALLALAQKAIADTFVPASTEVEIALEKIWRENLRQRHPISIESNFFNVGGHSLLAIKVLGQTNERFATRLTLKQLFEHNTIKTLGGFIESLQTKGQSSAVPDIPSLSQAQHEQSEEFTL